MKGPLAEYQAKTPRQRYMEHSEYVSFRTIIWVRDVFPFLLSFEPWFLPWFVKRLLIRYRYQETLYGGKAVPQIKKMIPAGAWS